MLLDPLIPLPWVIFLGSLLLLTTAYTQWRSARHLSLFTRLFLTTLRLSALALLLALLLNPVREEIIAQPEQPTSFAFGLDTSASMSATHSDQLPRIEAARLDLAKALENLDDPAAHHFFGFSDSAKPLSAPDLLTSPANGESTYFDTSIRKILQQNRPGQTSALFLFSDGHDFEMVSPAETARVALSGGTPIFPMTYGTLESARDASVRLANYHSYTFVRQKTELQVLVRLIGLPHEQLNLELLREGKPLQQKLISSDDGTYQVVSFFVTLDDPGQYQFSFRLSPAVGEQELSNNETSTFLNVIEEKLRVLEIEGAPFWDTTFLRRSLAQNDKFDIDSLVAFTEDRARPLSSRADFSGELKVPDSIDDLLPYNLVILGREVQKVIGTNGIELLQEWVENHNGIVVFARGKAWPAEVLQGRNLEPIDWATEDPRGTRLTVSAPGRNLAPFALLREVANAESFPEVITYPALGEQKTLAQTFSVTEQDSPAVVFRRLGKGQTLSIGVGNLWRWIFNPRANYANNAYDRFWDQLVLWLLANGGITAQEGYSLRAVTPDLKVGNPANLRLSLQGGEILPPTLPPIQISLKGNPVATIGLTPEADQNQALASFTPTLPGTYLATMEAPDGQALETRFIVRLDRSELIETAMDRDYLEALAQASGGRLIFPAELPDLLQNLLKQNATQDPLTKRHPILFHPFICFTIGLLLGIEWFFRRRIGLV